MYTLITTALTLILASAVAAAPTIHSRQTGGYVQSANFALHATGNANLAGWALRNAHVAGGRNVIELQRPSTYSSDVSYLNGTVAQMEAGQQKLAFVLDGTADAPFEVVLPTVSGSDVLQVFTKPLAGTSSFYLDDENLLSVWTYRSHDGFFACPQEVDGDGEVFVLWYGIGADANTLPSTECQGIQLQATF